MSDYPEPKPFRMPDPDGFIEGHPPEGPEPISLENCSTDRLMRALSEELLKCHQQPMVAIVPFVLGAMRISWRDLLILSLERFCNIHEILPEE